MITKELFTKILTEIKIQNKCAGELNKIFCEMENDFVDGAAFTNPKLTDMILQLLDAQFGEQCDWVRYWVYELDCGETWTPDSVVLANGIPLPLQTIDDLWNWCQVFMDNDIDF